MDRTTLAPQQSCFGQRANACPMSSATVQTSSSTIIPADETSAPRIGAAAEPLARHAGAPAEPFPAPAENPIPHRAAPVDRGFVLRGLSYAYRRPKLFTEAEGPPRAAGTPKRTCAAGKPSGSDRSVEIWRCLGTPRHQEARLKAVRCSIANRVETGSLPVAVSGGLVRDLPDAVDPQQIVEVDPPAGLL